MKEKCILTITRGDVFADAIETMKFIDVEEVIIVQTPDGVNYALPIELHQEFHIDYQETVFRDFYKKYNQYLIEGNPIRLWAEFKKK